MHKIYSEINSKKVETFKGRYSLSVETSHASKDTKTIAVLTSWQLTYCLWNLYVFVQCFQDEGNTQHNTINSAPLLPDSSLRASEPAEGEVTRLTAASRVLVPDLGFGLFFPVFVVRRRATTIRRITIHHEGAHFRFYFGSLSAPLRTAFIGE